MTVDAGSSGVGKARRAASGQGEAGSVEVFEIEHHDRDPDNKRQANGAGEEKHHTAKG